MTTLVIAHRTGPRDARENSLDGIATAAGLGADVVEVDARRSRDGTAVLLHDPLLLRVQHVPLPVKWLRDSQLARIGVPTLAEALEVAAERDVQLAIDTKDAGAAAAVLTAARTAGATERVLLWSQHMPAVRTYVRALPDAQVALLRDTFDPAGHDRLLADAAAIGARAVSAHQDVVTPAFIGAAADRGLAVYCWYQQLEVQEARLAEVAAAGLAGVVTDWPADARARLQTPG
ncbi:MAG TPA: glycerophosphodiester phosphodiesterase [Acidimicrobiia bacterium]|nr:glycerophosphodiester phosphodiesterase [Acidimicrobiia bacterium]